MREDSNGLQIFVYNLYEAKMLFHELVIYLIPLAFLLSFVLSGITLKIFSRAVEKNTEEDCVIRFWNFGASNFVSYFFIVLSVFCLIASSEGSAFSYVLFTLNTVFTAVFSYIGIKSLYYIIIGRGKSKIFAIILMIIAFALVSTFAFQLLAYFGVIINIVTNKISPDKKSKRDAT